MNKVLQQDTQSLDSILSLTKEIADQYYTQKESLPPSRLFKDSTFPDLPQQGAGAIDVLRHFQKHYADEMANSAGPRYFGFVTGGSTPASVAGDWLVSVYDQVMSGSNDSAAHFIERQAIHFLKQLFGLDTEYHGVFVTGATMSNFVSLATARQWIGEQHGFDFSEEGLFGSPEIKVISASPHSSILKSLSMLGLGRK
ncbi:MAG TPA: aspartate aminotransferase family protein, partial [Ohtaekwangia sp.]